ncbi:LytTR family DNA-binding domain-containing protein [Phenylobacterium sp.]|uniref:LytR/AlgR family response regulator transcription factor n=1 Tax=Phenylobacterium sp. TaxID=1871053 RepID=UPI00301E105A
MRVLVVDDEPLAVDWVIQGLKALADVEVVGSATDGDAALAQCAALAPDLVFLDIQMPGRTGLEVARVLGGEGGPDVVFVTAFQDFAAEAFELDAADYLLKPVRHDRLVEAMNRARRRRAVDRAHERLALLEARLAAVEGDGGPAAEPYPADFWISHRTGRVRVPVADIRRIEADRDYALIHTSARTHILRTTMRELERRLNPRQILRVHRGAFVRLSCVARVERAGRGLTRLHMADGAVVDVGASYLARVSAALGLEASGDDRAFP